MAPAAGAVSALRIDLPRTAGVRYQASLVDSDALRAGSGTAWNPVAGVRVLEGERLAALRSEPGALGVSDDLLRAGSGCSLEQLPAGHQSDSAAATEMDNPRHHPRNHSIHALLCSALSVRSDAFAQHEGFRALTGTAAADLRLRHFPLPVDGRGSDLQTGHGVYAGRGSNSRCVLRSGGRHCRTGSHPRSQFRTLRVDIGRRGHRVAV